MPPTVRIPLLGSVVLFACLGVGQARTRTANSPVESRATQPTHVRSRCGRFRVGGRRPMNGTHGCRRPLRRCSPGVCGVFPGC